MTGEPKTKKQNAKKRMIVIRVNAILILCVDLVTLNFPVLARGRSWGLSLTTGHSKFSNASDSNK